MAKLRVKVVQKLKKGNKIVGYIIQDVNGATMNVEANAFKNILRRGDAECINMTLTSDNRLVEHAIAQEAPKAAPKPVAPAQVAPAQAVPKPVEAAQPAVPEAPAAPAENPNAHLKDEAFITVSECNQCFVLGEEEDTISFEHGGSQTKSVETIVNKAKMMGRVLKKVNDDVYFIDFGNHKKIIVGLAKKLSLIDG